MITSVLIISLGVTPAFAQQGFSFAQPDFIFRITNIIEDIRIGFASAQDRIELIREFALDKQTRIDEATAKGEIVSMAIEERRLILIQKAFDEPNSISVANSIRAELNKISEMNEIRILYSQFPDCIENCTVNEKRMFNDKVNSLDTWKNKCHGTFDIDNYDYTITSYDKLTKLCPDLSKYTQKHLRLTVIGST